MNELERIFSDSHLVDFNLSQWDKMLELWVLADHFEAYEHRKPLIKVSFCKLKSILIEFNNMDVELDEGWQHCQWNTCELIYKEEGGVKKFRIIGDDPAPTISLSCKDVEYSIMNHSMLDSLFPGWENPYSPLARPGIEDLLARYSRKPKARQT